VARSQYRDGGQRGTVIADHTFLRARPAADGHVVGEVGAGESLPMVRASADGRWWLVQAGGDEVAWVAAQALAPPGTTPPRPKAARVPTRTAAPEIADVAPESPAAASEPASETAGDARAPVAELTVVAPAPARKSAIAIGAVAGVALLSRRFVSDGSGALSAFELSTTALAVGAGASFTRAIGRRFRLGFDAGYTWLGETGVRWRAPDGSSVVLGVQAHQVSAGLSAGLHFDALGGLELRARAGGRLDLNLLDSSVAVPLASDRLLGLTVGLGLDAPRLFAPSGHAIGAHAFALGTVFGARSENIDEGSDRGTWGVRAGAGLSLALWQRADRGRVLLSADYAYDLTLTHFAGPSRRDPTATRATMGTEQHLVTAALAYAY
jgi:hypothetical protein